MIENRAAPGPAWIRHLAGTTILMTVLLVAACAPQTGPAGPRLRAYAIDLTGGSKSCEIPKLVPVAGQSADAAIKVGNDGGWCGIGVQQDGVKPFGAGLLMTRPSHGTVLIHEVGDNTRIDYTPDRGFAGTDGFAVKLIPGDATVNVAVTVIPQQT